MTETQDIRAGDEVEATIRGTAKFVGPRYVSIAYKDVDGDEAVAPYLPRESARFASRPVRVGDVVDESTPDMPAGTVLELTGNGDGGVARVLVRGLQGRWYTTTGLRITESWEAIRGGRAAGAKVLTLGSAQ